MKCMVCGKPIDPDEDYIETEDGAVCIVCSGDDTDEDEDILSTEEQWTLLDQEQLLDF